MDVYIAKERTLVDAELEKFKDQTKSLEEVNTRNQGNLKTKMERLVEQENQGTKQVIINEAVEGLNASLQNELMAVETKQAVADDEDSSDDEEEVQVVQESKVKRQRSVPAVRFKPSTQQSEPESEEEAEEEEEELPITHKPSSKKEKVTLRAPASSSSTAESEDEFDFKDTDVKYF